ncbi:hypothetical protein Hsc_0060 [Herbaspirillum seropedicae]|nr:hypothetical protein Hsc_0060 [Herbaspirillum seropedicae]
MALAGVASTGASVSGGGATSLYSSRHIHRVQWWKQKKFDVDDLAIQAALPSAATTSVAPIFSFFQVRKHPHSIYRHPRAALA